MVVRNLRVIETYNFLDLRKPRYFFNQLMRDQAEDTVNWELCANQKAINNAYSSRGLHFYPVNCFLHRQASATQGSRLYRNTIDL